MIGYLQGEVIESSEGRILMGVGDRSSNGCVGYLVSVPHRADYLSFLPRARAELYIYTHVREEAFDLYGFTQVDEKELFLTLLSVNGVGPKSALGILSSTEPKRLIEAIIGADQGFLTQVPGIGKKTAERIVVELRDALRKKRDLGLFRALLGSSTSQQQVSMNRDSRLVRSSGSGSVFEDAKSALVGLGYREQEIQTLLNRVVESMDAPPAKAEDLIKTALRQLV